MAKSEEENAGNSQCIDENSNAPQHKKETLSVATIASKQQRKIRVTLLHSKEHTHVLHETMQYIHQDRDILLAALLDYCGFLNQSPKFIRVVVPKSCTRKHLESFHYSYYLDLLEFTTKEHDYDIVNLNPVPSLTLLDTVGLVDDCPIPPQPGKRAALWNYCCSVAGGSLHAAQLLASGQTEVAIHWGGGRHHAHPAAASGFCYVNDVVLSIKHLQRQMTRILYIDIDIHHADGVQNAFYDTDQVMTVSFHRHAKGFFPASGCSSEKGMHGTSGVGYNLNIPLPHACYDTDFIDIYKYTVPSLMDTFKPEAVVMCVGADGLAGDPLVKQQDGWNLSPEGLAECVRYISDLCRETKLLLLGGGGYHPARTARTFLLCTAAACECARPGMLKELPRDVPRHEYFPRYGPHFRLVDDSMSAHEKEERSDIYESTFVKAREEIDLAILFLQAQTKKRETPQFGSYEEEDDLGWSSYGKKATKKGRRRK